MATATATRQGRASRMERPQARRTAFAHSEARLTFEDMVLGAWEDLAAEGRAGCLVCGGSMSAAHGCSDCGSRLS